MDPAASAAPPMTDDTPARQHVRARREIDALRAAQRFSETGDLLMLAEADQGVTTVNAAWTAATGWTLDELKGRPWTDLLFAEDREGLEERLAAGGSVREVFRTVAKQGLTRWVEGSVQRDGRGSVICLLRDITDDRDAQAPLQDARDSHLLMRLGGMGRWSWDPEHGTTLSPELIALFGLAPDWADAGGDFLDLCHPDDRPLVMAALSKAAVEGGSGSYQHRSATGKGRWLHLRVVFKSEPHPTGGYSLQGMVQDVTELAEARDAAVAAEHKVRGLMEEARAASQRLRLALGAAQAGVFEIDHAAKRFWCSPEFVLLTGQTMTYEEASSRPWGLVAAQDAPERGLTFEGWSAGAALKAPMDVRVARPDGSLRWMRLYSEARRDAHGEVLRSVGLLLDIDERKRQELALVEAERAANAGAEAKARFLASVSHEIRTPLNGVLGVLHLFKSESLSDDGRKLLDEALGCGQMLSELINDVLDFSKIEADEMELAPEPTDPFDTLTGVANLLRPLAWEKGLSLTVDADPAIGWVDVDPIRLRQALFNLIGNAIKFTLEGGVSLRLRAAPGQGIVFEVSDTGVGIAPEARSRLFERFQQADTSTTRRFGGTGLGLAITRRLATLMGGDVDFDSVEGEGSTFRLRIDAPSTPAPGGVQAVAPEGLGGLRVLVVEDNPTNRLIARKLLEQLGAFVAEAEDGERGVAAALAGGHDLILMDVQMPGMDGLEATRRIRAGENPRRRTPIIALTADVLSHQTNSYTKAGMNGVIAKPISPALMLTEIARVALEGADTVDAALGSAA